MAERIRSRNFLALTFTTLVVLGLIISAFTNSAKTLGSVQVAAGYGYGPAGQNWTTLGGVAPDNGHLKWSEKNCNGDASVLKTFHYGNATDQFVAGDWNHNATVTPGVKRGNAWYLRNYNSNGAPNISFRFGTTADQPLAGRWVTAAGRNWNPGAHRRSTNWWYLRNSQTSGGADIAFQYGNASDAAFVGDWDHSGTFTPAVRRGNTWYLRNSNTPGRADVTFTFGLATDRPIVGDWDGNGTWTTGVVRGTTVILTNSNAAGTGELTFSLQTPGFTRTGNWDGLNSATC